MVRVSKPILRIRRIYSQVLVLIEKDVHAIANLAQYGEKLPSGPAKDLRDYAKLLEGMQDTHKKMEAEKALEAKAATKAVPDEALMQAVTGAGGVCLHGAQDPRVCPTCRGPSRHIGG